MLMCSVQLGILCMLKTASVRQTEPEAPLFVCVQVVGCIVEHDGKVLLCRRAIQPCKGLWTVPAGFLEMGESTAAGAARETWEEANARVEVRTASALSPLWCMLQTQLPTSCAKLAHAMLYPPDKPAPGPAVEATATPHAVQLHRAASHAAALRACRPTCSCCRGQLG